MKSVVVDSAGSWRPLRALCLSIGRKFITTELQMLSDGIQQKHADQNTQETQDGIQVRTNRSLWRSLKRSGFASEGFPMTESCYTELWEDSEYPENEWHPQRIEWISASAVNLHPPNSQQDEEKKAAAAETYWQKWPEATWVLGALEVR